MLLLSRLTFLMLPSKTSALWYVVAQMKVTPNEKNNKYIYVILLTNWNRLCLTFLSLLSHAACLGWPGQEWFSVFSNMQFSEITIIFTNTFLMKRFSVVQVRCAGVCILHNGTKKADCVFLNITNHWLCRHLSMETWVMLSLQDSL